MEEENQENFGEDTIVNKSLFLQVKVPVYNLRFWHNP